MYYQVGNANQNQYLSNAEVQPQQYCIYTNVTAAARNKVLKYLGFDIKPYACYVQHYPDNLLKKKYQ